MKGYSYGTYTRGGLGSGDLPTRGHACNTYTLGSLKELDEEVAKET